MGGFTSTDDAIEYTASVVNQWDSNGVSFYQYDLQFTNISGRELSGWNLTLNFNSEISLADGWNGEYAVNGTKISIIPKDYNSTVASGGTVSGIGFIVSPPDPVENVGCSGTEEKRRVFVLGGSRD